MEKTEKNIIIEMKILSIYLNSNHENQHPYALSCDLANGKKWAKRILFLIHFLHSNTNDFLLIYENSHSH
jgi:hypothetical protein